MYTISPQNNKRLFEQIYDQVKHKIENGQLQSKEKVPSIRQFATQYHVSKGTVEKAYQQLVLEGYLVNKPQSGYYVEIFDPDMLPTVKKIPPSISLGLGSPHPTAYQTDGIGDDGFDLKQWKKEVNSILEYRQEELKIPPLTQGEYHLRAQISSYVRIHRGVRCIAEQVIVSAGTQLLLGTLARYFKHHTDIAFEDPGFTKGANVFLDYGFQLHSIPVIGDHLEATHPPSKLIYLSPAHQYPTGSVMSIKTRLSLLQWAKREDAMIIEDDYDGLMRYEGAPIPSLQSLSDADNIIYIGSFSKMTAPFIRLSFMVLPLPIATDPLLQQTLYTQSVSKVDQLAFASFLQNGGMERHIRRLRKIYARKSKQLQQALDQYRIQTSGWGSGMHIVIKSSPNRLIALSKAAKKQGIAIEVIGQRQDIAAFQFSGLKNEEIPAVASFIDQYINK